MINWGTVPAGSVLPFMFGSYDGATGASEAISGLALGDILVYKGTSMTQRASTAGFTLIDTDGIDLDSQVGINGISIDTGDNTDASFYAVGSFFTVVIASITADGQTVNFVLGTFRLGAAETTTGKAPVTSDVTATAIRAEIDSNSTQLAKIGSPAGASVSADIASIKTDTGTTLPGRLPAALASDGSMKSSLQSVLGTAFTEGAAGRIAAAFKQFFNIASPASTMDAIVAVTTVTTTTNLTNAPPDSSGVTTLLSRIPSTLFSGITQLSHWLGMLAGKQAANATALTEIKATGAGSGTYDPTTDSLEAVRDNTGTAGAGLTAADDATITAIAALNNLSAAQVTAAVPTAIQNADALLDRDMSVGTDSGSPTVRTPRQALRASRNKVSIAAGTLTVTKEDDSTASWTAAVTTAAGNPISAIDPA